MRCRQVKNDACMSVLLRPQLAAAAMVVVWCLGHAPACHGAAMFIRPAEPYYFLDDDTLKFRMCIVGKVRKVTLVADAWKPGYRPTLAYEIEVMKVVRGNVDEKVIMLRGWLGYYTLHKMRGDRRKSRSPYAPGDIVCLPVERDESLTPQLQEGLRLPSGVYYRIEDMIPDNGDMHDPWDVDWSKEFMEGLVRYVDLREQAAKLEEAERGAFWLKRVVPSENIYVRIQAIWWLGELKYKPALARMVQVLTEGGRDHGNQMRRVTGFALRKFPRELYAPLLSNLATHSEPEVRREAISNLLIGATDPDPLCDRYWSDPDVQVRLRLVSTAAGRGYWRFVERALRDRELAVRQKAKELLAERNVRE